MGVNPLAFGIEDAQHFGGARAGGAHRVRGPRVELGGLTAGEHEVLLAEAKPQLPGEHVDPFESVVDPQCGQLGHGRVGDLVGADR